MRLYQWLTSVARLMTIATQLHICLARQMEPFDDHPILVNSVVAVIKSVFVLLYGYPLPPNAMEGLVVLTTYTVTKLST